jgi:putative ABC transport system permease protein
MRASFIVAEVALCVVLLAGAALTARTLMALHRQALGLEPSGVIAVQAPLHFSQTDGPRAYSELIERLRNLPGVESIGATNALPMSGGGSNGNFQIEGRQVLNDSDQTWAAWRVVDEGYFRTLQIPVSVGRPFAASDRGGESVVVINQAMARAYWPGKNPVGERIAIPGFDQQTFARFRAGGNEWFTIVGIVGDVRDESVSAPPVPQLYVPYFQRRDADLDIVLRTGLPVTAIENAVKQVIHDFDPQVPVRVVPLEEFLSTSIATPRLRSLLIGAFASIAWILAAVGLYGVMAFAVERRTAEIGVRSVFGATRFNLLSMVIGRGLTLVAIGLAAGIVVVLALRGLIGKFLYGVSAADPVALVGVCVLLLAMGIVASVVPARRATKVDPMVALRYE